jgi:hypothetical protein
MVTPFLILEVVAVVAVEAEVTLATLAVRGGGGVLAQQPHQLN